MEAFGPVLLNWEGDDVFAVMQMGNSHGNNNMWHAQQAPAEYPMFAVVEWLLAHLLSRRQCACTKHCVHQPLLVTVSRLFPVP